jgi:tRNA pseudouridine65 synthase
MKILLQSKDYVVVHKDSGLVTYADSKEMEKKSAKGLLELQLKRKLFPVHRIDKDTCGVLTFAFHAKTAQELTSLFRSRVVKKQYLALVHGETLEKFSVDLPLEKNKEKVKEPAQTEFVRLAFVKKEIEGEERFYSLVKCDPKTGRYHQIRRHLRMAGHPIIGDPEYGNSWENRAFEKLGVKRTLLSAVSLAFPDRSAEKMVKVQTKPDRDFVKTCEFLGLKV